MRKKRILTEEHKRKIGDSVRGKKHPPLSEESLVRIREAAAKRRGVKRGQCPDWLKKKISEATKGVKKTITSPNAGWFPGGHVPWTKGRKKTKEILPKKVKEKSDLTKRREWSKRVKLRDGYRCMNCGMTENLHAHHIIPWKKRPELAFELSNGITYCWSCHNKEEWKNRERVSRKRSKFTDEQRKKLSIAHLGQKSWNKGIRKEEEKIRVCKVCGIEKNIDEFTPSGDWHRKMCKKCRNLGLKVKKNQDDRR